MKKQLILLALFFTCLTPVMAQVEGEPAPMTLSTEPPLTYVSLLNELQQNISAESFVRSWSSAYTDWTKNGENKNTYKQSGVLLTLISNHLKSNLFKPEWMKVSNEWHNKVAACKDKKEFVGLLKDFESMLMPETCVETWKEQRITWLKNIEKKLAE